MKLERDFEIILRLIAQYSGKKTWYPLARKTKLTINGILKKLSTEGYISSFKVSDNNVEKEYFSIKIRERNI